MLRPVFILCLQDRDGSLLTLLDRSGLFFQDLPRVHRRRPVDAVYGGPATKREAHHAKVTDGIKAGLRAIYEPEDHRSERLLRIGSPEDHGEMIGPHLLAG